MAAMSTIALVGAGLAGGMLAAKAMTPKMDTPNPQDMPKQDAADEQRKAQGAANQQRKRAMAAQGRSDTILTGPKGLGELAAENRETKTILGY